MTDFKKGGPLQNSNIFATNRLFVKNKLFKKRKKKRAPGVYNPKAKFKYEDGGDISIPELNKGGKPCPSGQQWNPYTKKCEAKLEDRTFLNLMRDRKYGLLQAFKHAPKSSYNPKYIQNLKEFTVTASKKNKAKKNKKKTDVFSSDYEKLVEQYDKLKNSPLLANQEKAEALLRQIKEIKLYTPPKNQISFEGDPIENFINKHILDDAMGKASVSAEAITEKDEDEIDNFRHPQAGRYAAEAIVNYFPEWAQYTGIPQTAGLLGANAMGVGHELGTIFGDPRWFDDAYKNNEAPSFLEKAKIILGESGEDIFNNAVGAGVGVLPMNSRDKTNTLLELSNQNMLPDGIVTKDPSKNLYLKKGPNDPGKFKNPYKQKDGGIILDLTKDQIDKYVKGGYIVEEVSDPSIATLNRFIGGGSTDCPPGYKWDGKKCVEDPFMQGLMSRMRQGNQSKKSIPALTRKAPKQPVNNSFSNKALLNKEIKQQKNKNAVLQKTFPEVTITGTKTGHMPESFGENVAEFFDPTGYLSWGDAKNAYSDWQESGMNLPTWRQAADMFGAVPALGKFGKLKYLDPSSIKTLYKTIPWQQVINIGDTGEDIDSDNLNQKRNGGSLEKLKPGGANKGCPPGTYWNGTKCTKLVTLKNDKKYIDGVANWAMHSADPNAISSEYNDQIKDRLYSGKWGFDPESGALVRLDKIQPQSVTKVDDKTKASREKEKLAEKNYYADIENKKAYEESIKGAGFDPATFGKAKGTNVITGEPIYASSKEEADRINQEAINQAAIEGHAAVVNNPVFKAAASFTPAGMAVGAMEGLSRFIPDAVTLAQDPTLANAGQLGLDALQALPVVGKPLASATGKAFNYVKNLEPSAPGPLMLLGRTNSGSNMVKKNMNYYKQLLDSYDGKKISAANRKFYNDLIKTANKQDGMVTEAQLRELDRLKSGNFDFGKKGYSLNFEQILKLPDEDILNKTGKSKEDWELFIEAKPDKYGKALEDTYNSAYNPTQEQLANIEAGKQQLLDFYSSGEYNRRLQNAIPGLSFMDTHNYQNNLINAINKTKPRYVQSKNYGTLESDAMAYTSGADASGTKLGIDFSSTGLSRPDAKYLSSHEFGHASLYDDKNKKLLENLPKLSLDEETLKNWTKWGKESGNEAYDDMINYYSNPDEARQRGINAILYSKEAGMSTDDLVDMPYNQVIQLSREGKIPKDIVELRQIYDQKELKDYLKKLYSIGIPTAGVIGTATMLANPFEGSNGLQQQKKGGSTDDYIEIDIPEKEIQKYIDQGYIVEPVSKLKKFIS